MEKVEDIPIFARIMPRSKYLLLLKMFHMDNNELQAPGDRLHKFFPLLLTILRRFLTAYYPHQPLCIDESILKFKGRLAFKQYIPNKRHRFGVKLFIFCDSITGYILNFKIYTGKIEAIEDEKQSTSMKTVLNLLKPYLNRDHVLHIDNFYTSPSLFYKLYDAKTNACGTIRTNRRGLPKFPKIKKGERVVRVLDGDYSKFLAIKWCDKRDVHIFTSNHDDSLVTTIKDKKTEFIQKRKCIVEYHKFMGLVDKVDMQLSFTDADRKTIKWCGVCISKKIIYIYKNFTTIGIHIKTLIQNCCLSQPYIELCNYIEKPSKNLS